MLGHPGLPWEMDWSSVYSARTLTLPDYVHGRVVFTGDAAHLLPIFGVRDGKLLTFALDRQTGKLLWEFTANTKIRTTLGSMRSLAYWPGDKQLGPQILFGTDYWYRTAEETGRGLTTNKVFSEAELKMIDRGNAEKMLPKYKA